MTRLAALALTLTIAAHALSADPPQEFSNSIGMKFTLIPAGEFMMGSPATEQGRHNLHEQQHRVRITKSFYLAVTEVTQEQYEKVMGKNPSYFSSTAEAADKVKGMDASSHPVDNLSWDEAVEFCQKLSAMEGRLYRLPAEAEWEYACRAGTTTAYHFGSDEANLKEYAWYGAGQNADGKTHAVAQKKPNAWGLYDMHGNVWEWCQDRLERSYRAVRGGSWYSPASVCRSAWSRRSQPNYYDYTLGFRVAADLPASQASEGSGADR